MKKRADPTKVVRFPKDGYERKAMAASETQNVQKAAKRHWRITLNSPVILVFVVLCAIATALGYATGGASTKFLFMTYHSSLADPLTYVRFFTHVLGHSGWEHFVGNMAFILLLGPLLEEKYGPRALIITILVTALATSLVSYLFFPGVGLCGASGVVFAFIIMSSVTSANQGEIPLTFILVAVIYLGQQIYTGVFVDNNVSELSHIIGGIVGGVIGFVLNRRKLGMGASSGKPTEPLETAVEEPPVSTAKTFADQKVEKLERFYMDK